ncbi:MAG: glycosyl hydrolase [Verrucomicrobiota bacterium JB022]|nr:glycosyl hydrolase [Verrucomicrobiota bacterium JB022]
MNPLRNLTLLALLPVVLPVVAQADRAEEFAQPGREYQAKFRWWWPHGLVDNAEIAREVRDMAAAGFGGAEIADVHHSVRDRELAPDTHGWGTQPWVDAVTVAFETAREHGMELDLTIGPSWPAAVPTVDPDHPAAMKELAVGFGQGSFPMEVPQPRVHAERGVNRQELRFVQAARVVSGDPAEKGKWVLQQDSLVDVTDKVRDGVIHWTPPSDGEWVVLAYWLRGSAQQPERGPHTEPESYVVDHFSEAGTRAVTDFWEQNILNPHLRELIKDAGGNLFEDSLEMETDSTIWTPGFAQEFQKRKGYDLMPYLPLVVQEHEKNIITYEGYNGSQVVHDFWDVLWQLYMEHHQHALQAWAAELGLGLRTQPYGMPTDAMLSAAHLDIVEGESLGFKNLDDYRSLAGGRDMGGHTVMSNEAAAYAGGAYSTTWQRVLTTLNPIFAAGVNQTFFHGYAYAEVPDVKWPGFAAFSPYGTGPGYAEAWGPRQPSWQHVPDIADYFARVQWVLQQGKPQVDVAFLRQEGYAGSGFGAPWFTTEGDATGWTHSFVAPSLLELPLAKAKNGRLAPDGANYQLLAFEGNAFRGKSITMPVQTAEKLYDYARKGKLPMIVVGDWSQPSTSGLPQKGEEAELKKIFDKLLKLPNVINVPDRESIGEAVAKLDLDRPVKHPNASLVHAHRRDGKIDYFYFSNAGKDATGEVPVSIRPSAKGAQAFEFDPWTGEIFLLPQAQREGDRYVIPVSLSPGDSRILAFAPKGTFPQAKEHQPLGPVADTLTLGDWQLTIEAWTPGDKATETKKTEHEVALDTLQPWTELPGHEFTSGLGRYTTEVEVPAEWLDRGTVTLSLGEVFDTAQVTLNGQTLPTLNPLHPVVDVTEHLQPGENTLQVEVSTTLNNQLREAHKEVFGNNSAQPYGMMGPVELRHHQPQR